MLLGFTPADSVRGPTLRFGGGVLRKAAASVGIVSRLALVPKLETSRMRPPECTSAMGNLVPTIWHLPNSLFTCMFSKSRAKNFFACMGTNREMPGHERSSALRKHLHWGGSGQDVKVLGLRPQQQIPDCTTYQIALMPCIAKPQQLKILCLLSLGWWLKLPQKCATHHGR